MGKRHEGEGGSIRNSKASFTENLNLMMGDTETIRKPHPSLINFSRSFFTEEFSFPGLVKEQSIRVCMNFTRQLNYSKIVLNKVYF